MIRRGVPRPQVDIFTVNKRIWTSEEDDNLRLLVEQHGSGSWSVIGDIFPGRTGKQCRERWTNHLCPGVKKGDWTEEEDRIIMTMQKALGNQWAKITKMLPGRTDNAVKNRFHAAIRHRMTPFGNLNDVTESGSGLHLSSLYVDGAVPHAFEIASGNGTSSLNPGEPAVQLRLPSPKFLPSPAISPHFSDSSIQLSRPQDAPAHQPKPINVTNANPLSSAAATNSNSNYYTPQINMPGKQIGSQPQMVSVAETINAEAFLVPVQGTHNQNQNQTNPLNAADIADKSLSSGVVMHTAHHQTPPTASQQQPVPSHEQQQLQQQQQLHQQYQYHAGSTVVTPTPATTAKNENQPPKQQIFAADCDYIIPSSNPSNTGNNNNNATGSMPMQARAVGLLHVALTSEPLPVAAIAGSPGTTTGSSIAPRGRGPVPDCPSPSMFDCGSGDSLEFDPALLGASPPTQIHLDDSMMDFDWMSAYGMQTTDHHSSHYQQQQLQQQHCYNLSSSYDDGMDVQEAQAVEYHDGAANNDYGDGDAYTEFVGDDAMTVTYTDDHPREQEDYASCCMSTFEWAANTLGCGGGGDDGQAAGASSSDGFCGFQGWPSKQTNSNGNNKKSNFLSSFGGLCRAEVDNSYDYVDSTYQKVEEFYGFGHHGSNEMTLSNQFGTN